MENKNNNSQVLELDNRAIKLAELEQSNNATGKDLILSKDIKTMGDQFEFMKGFAKLVKDNLELNVDYGKAFSSSSKNVLLKSGMEKILLSYGLYAELTELKEMIDFNKKFVFYKFKATLKTKNGSVISVGYGSANNFEKAKKSMDFYTAINNLMKIAIKRAKMDAVLGLGAFSGVFTQDFGDNDNDSYKAAPEKEKTVVATPNDGKVIYINCLRYYFARERGNFTEAEKLVVEPIIKEAIALFNKSFLKSVVALDQATNTAAELEAIFGIFKKITDMKLTKPATKESTNENN